MAPRSLDPSAPSVGLYHNRNRWLSPELGRFLQRDPNETTLPIVTAIAFNGDTLAIVLGVFDPQGHYGDGLNLYAYLGSNPVNLRDPLGLVFDPFEDVDDAIGAMYAERSFHAEEMAQFFVGLGAAVAQAVFESMICAFVPGGVLLVATVHFVMAVEDIDKHGLNWGNGLELATSAIPIIGRAYGSGARVFRGYQSQMARLQTMRAARAGRTWRFRGLPSSLRGGVCFAAGTLVLMADGTARTIETVRVGDTVLCDVDPSEDNGPETATVTAVRSRTAQEIMSLQFVANEQLIALHATPEHPFYDQVAGTYVPAGDLPIPTAVATLNGPSAVLVGRSLLPSADRAVYNISVDGAHSYYVSAGECSVSLLVHNANICSQEWVNIMCDHRKYRAFLQSVENTQRRLNQAEWDDVIWAAGEHGLVRPGEPRFDPGHGGSQWNFPHVHLDGKHIGLADGVVP